MITASSPQPIKVSKANAKRTINAFLETGRSNHSGLALTLPLIINYCEENHISYKLTAHPGVGYFIERIPSIK